jgi:hypothetical protein
MGAEHGRLFRPAQMIHATSFSRERAQVRRRRGVAWPVVVQSPRKAEPAAAEPGGCGQA